ncbi:MAG: lipoate--protein ligase family protein [Pseudomonadota bacterium]
MPPQRLPLETALAREVASTAEVKGGRFNSGAILWEAEARCLVAPRAMSGRLRAGLAGSERRGWPCHFRVTGGDVTPQGPGVLSLGLAFRQSAQATNAISDAYAAICAPIIDALAACGVEAATGAVEGSYCDGAFNVTVDGLKFAGTALRMSPMRDGDWAVLGQAMFLVEPGDAGFVHAINALYADAGISRRVRSDVTVSLADLGVQERFLAALEAGLSLE